MVKRLHNLMMVTVLAVATAGRFAAQGSANDASVRLREVLPADVAARILATIATARSRDLPT